MIIHEVDTASRREVTRFINIPFQLYTNNDQWVPPIRPDARLQLNRKKNPFYQKNDAAFFIAEKTGQDVGRLAVLNPIFYNEFKGTHNAHFYLFDCADDQAAANALFDRAREWAQARGLKIIRGPLGFMAADPIGMLADGFENRPAISSAFNYAYYNDLVRNWGFELEERVYSGYIDVPKILANFPQRVLDIAEKVKKRYGFEIRRYTTKKQIREHVAPKLAELYNQTLTHIAGDPPLSQAEVDVVADSLLMIAKPDLLPFIYRGDEIVGFLFCFLDPAEGIKKARGRLLPFGLFHILRALQSTDWINLNGMGILPEFQGRGGTAIMYAELYNSIKRYPRIKHGDVVQISEFNHQSLNEMPKFGIEWYKTHHIYRKEI